MELRFAAFADRDAAKAFARGYGGDVLAFDEVAPDIADLRAGGAYDEQM